MPTFGAYETVRELHRSGITAVWSARAAGKAGPEKFVVKTIETLGHFLADSDPGGGVAAFLDAAAAQAKAAEAGGGHWARIHQSGKTDDGGYYVSDAYSSSLETVVRGRVKSGGAGLFVAASAIVAGLLELRSACDRRHGDLRLSNVLLAGQHDLAQASIVLTDPAPAERLAAATSPAADLAAVGEILYQLVMFRPSESMGGISVADSPEWSALGANGDAWRALVNDLLAAGRQETQLTLELVAERIAGLRAKRKRITPVRMLIVGVLLAVVAAGVWFTPQGQTLLEAVGLVAPSDTRTLPPVADYVDLCIWHGDWYWELEGLDETVWNRWDRDEVLRNVRALRRDAIADGTELDRSKAAKRDGVNRPEVADMAPATVDELHGAKSFGELESAIEESGASAELGKLLDQLDRPEMATDTRRAHEAIKSIRDELGGRFLTPVEQAQADYGSRDWTRPANYLGRLTSNLRGALDGRPLAADKTVVVCIDDVLDVKDPAVRIAENYGTLTRRQKAIAGDGPDVLRGFGDWAGSSLRSDGRSGTRADLDKLQADLEELASLADRLAVAAEHYKAKVNPDLFGKRYPSKATPPAKADFDNFIVQVYEPAVQKLLVADPRDTWDWQGPAKAADAKLAKLNDELKDAAHVREGQSWRADVLTKKDKILARTWDSTTKKGIEDGIEAINGELTSLNAELDYWIRENYLPADTHPLRKWNWQAALADLDGVFALLAEHPDSGLLAKRLAEQVRSPIDNLQPGRTPWIRAGKSRIEQDVAAVQTALKVLERDALKALAAMDPRTVVYAELAAADKRWAELGEMDPAAKASFEGKLNAARAKVETLRAMNWPAEKGRVLAECGAADGATRQLVAAVKAAMTGKINVLRGIPAESDPRQGWAWRKAADAIAAGIESARLAGGGGTRVGQMQAGLKIVTAGIEQLTDAGSLGWNNANRKRIEDGKAAAEETMAKLAADVNALQDELRQKLAADLRNRNVPASPAIRNAWTTHLAAIEKAKPTPAVLRAKTDALLALLTDLSRRLPADLPAGARPVSLDLAQARKVFAVKREAALAEVARAVKLDENLTVSLGLDRQAWAARHDQWRTDAAGVLADYAAIEGQLDLAYGMAEKSNAGETIGQRVGKWAGKAVSRELTPAMAGLTDRLGQMAAVDSMSRADLATRALRPDDAALAVAGWRRLGRSAGTPWPANAADLRAELRIRANLTSLIDNRIAGPGRQGTLRTEVADEGRQRWRTAFENVAETAESAIVIRQAGQFGASLDPAKPDSDFHKVGEKARYQFLLLGLKAAAADSAQSAEQLGAKRAAFVAGVRKHCPKLLAADARAAGLVAAINAVQQVAHRLAGAYGLDELAPGSAKTLAALTANWNQPGLGKDFAGMFVSLTQRVDALRKIEKDSSLTAAALQGQAKATDLLLARAAWRRLGAGPWPANVADLRVESDILANLTRLVDQAIVDAPRKAFLSKELSAEGRRRWQQCLKAASADKDVAAVIALAANFDVDLTTLPEPTRYKIIRNRLALAAADKARTDKQLSDSAAKFVADVGRHCPALGGQSPAKELVAAVKALRKVADRLAGAYGLTEPVPGGGPTLEKLAADIEAAPELPELFGTLRARIRELRLIETDPKVTVPQLTTHATAGDLIVARAAWRRLGGLAQPGWPATPAQLRAEGAIRANLAGLINKRIADQQRKDMLRAELAGEGLRRWRVCLANVTADADVEMVLDMMTEFGVTTDQLGEPEKYKTLQFRFSRAMADPKMTPAAAAAGRKAFVADVRGTCPKLAGESPAKELLGALQALPVADALLANAYGLAEPAPGGGKALGKLAADIEAVGNFPAIFAPIKQRLATLRKVHDDAGMTVEQLQGHALSRGDLALARAAWQKLGKLTGRTWPATIADLHTESLLRVNLAGLINAKISDRSRRAALKAELFESGRHRWQLCLGSVSAAKEIPAVIKRAAEFGWTIDPSGAGGDFAKLDERARLNVLLYGLNQALADEKIADKLLVDRRKGLVAAIAHHCPALAGQSPIKQILDALGKIKVDQAGGDVATQLGPAWRGKVEKVGGGEVVSYTWTLNPKHKLTFLPVRPAGQSKPSYVCTTEVSMGLFVEMMESAKLWPAIKGRLPTSVSAKAFSGWTMATNAVAVRSSGWWRPRDPQLTFSLYPKTDGFPPAKPDAGHPMHRLSPAVAMLLATTMNCRPQTSAEWLAAYGVAAPPKPGQVNLRDGTWAQQNTYFVGKSKGTRLGRYWGDMKLFTSGGVSARMGTTAKPVTTEVDRYLWYAPVGSGVGGPFTHLVGNVAEYTFDAGAAFERQFKAPGSATIAGIEAFLADGANKGKLAVIGGSALSPPGLWDGKHKPWGTAYPVDPVAAAGSYGYADVGMRLAFTAPSRSQRQMTLEVLGAESGYVTAATP